MIVDENEVVNKAPTQHEQSLFSNALGFVKQNKVCDLSRQR